MRKELLHRYESLEALPNFRVGLPNDYSPKRLLDYRDHTGRVLDRVDLVGHFDGRK
jgi:hypothetical protein